MIRINRRKVNPPKVLTDPNERGAKERQRAIEFYSNPANQDKSFPFKVYSDPEVKQALNQLFHFKCAYCESYFGATQPVDVEHFRPKGSMLVDGKPRGLGYYWLASDWDNLLPSCIDCNRPRTQEIPGENPQVMGKATEFPIANEQSRATGPGQESQEKRLLLNPCLDNPDKHLVFDVSKDNEVVLRAAMKPDGKESPMGKESIRVYALQRKGLAWARRDRILLIKAQVKTVDNLVSLFNENPENKRIQNMLRDEMRELKRLLKDDQPYAGMARQYANRHFKQR